jgi:DUF4097 and DUF4098 domain-containing protein YvlB
MKAPIMRATRSLVLTSFCALFAAAPSAQGTPPPPLPATPTPAAAVTPRGAWFERYQEARGGPESSDRWSRSFKTGPSGSLDLSNISGDIVVTGGPGDEIRVEAVKKVHAREAHDAKQQLEAVTIEATERGGRVEIATNYLRKQNTRVDVFYMVQVPASASVSLRSISGSLELTGVKGEARLETVSGNITTSNSLKLAKVKSVSGDVSVTEGGSADVLSLGTVSGNLSANRVKARTLEAQTISGDLTLIDTHCDRLQAKSVSGDMRFGGPLAKGGRYEFNTHSGDVRLSLAGSTGFELTANSFSGELRSDVPLSGRQGDAVPTGDDDEDDDGHHPGMRRSELRGTYGDGSALVVVQTFSGDLVVGGPGGEKSGAPKDKRKHKDPDKDWE